MFQPADEIARLSKLALEARAAGRTADVFDYWCEVAAMIAALSVETHGWSVQVPVPGEGWAMGVPLGSMSALCEVCDLARAEQSLVRKEALRPRNSSRLLRLRELSESVGGEPAERAARVLALSILAGPRLELHAAECTAELLGALTAAASEFEGSWSEEAFETALAREPPTGAALARRDGSRAFLLYVKDRRTPRGSAYATVRLFGEPAPPRAGEVARALEASARLAQGRLLPGPFKTPLHPRYDRDSLSVCFRGGMSLAQESIRRLSAELNRTFAKDWWFGMSEYFELGAGDSYTADLAGWLRARVPNDPRSKPNPPPSDPDPARETPDFIGHWRLDGASSEEQQRRAALYRRAGVPWYWTLDLVSGVLRVQRLVDGQYRVECIAGARRRVAFPPFESVSIDLGRVFLREGREDAGSVPPSRS